MDIKAVQGPAATSATNSPASVDKALDGAFDAAGKSDQAPKVSAFSSFLSGMSAVGDFLGMTKKGHDKTMDMIRSIK